jgi:hypothetical protein
MKTQQQILDDFKTLLLVGIVGSAIAVYTADQYVRGRTYLDSGNKTLDPLYPLITNHNNEGGRIGTGDVFYVDSKVVRVTGDVFYVDSNVANEGDGTSWTRAKDTLDEAVALCAIDNGDVILVAQGHAETMRAD